MSNQALDEDWSGHRLGVALGIERRVKLKKEEVQFKYGFDIGYIYDVQDRNWNSSANNEQSLEIKTNSILANLVFGINYLPSDRFILSLEVMPGIQIVKSKQSQTVRTEFFDEVTTSSQTTQIDSVFLNSGLVAPRFTISYRI